MYFALVVHRWSSFPRAVCDGWFVLLRHTSIHCLRMLARVGINTIHTILISFRLGCSWVFPHTTLAPRRWRPLVLHLVVGSVHFLALAASSLVVGLQGEGGGWFS